MSKLLFATHVILCSAHDPEMFAFSLQKEKNGRLFQCLLFLQGTTELKKAGGKEKSVQ